MQEEVGDASIMTKEREYRAHAGTCVDLANKATNDEDKKHLLAMAEAWLGLAEPHTALRPTNFRHKHV